MAEIILEAAIIESKLHKEHATMIFKVKSAQMVHPHKKNVLLRIRGVGIFLILSVGYEKYDSLLSEVYTLF